MRDDEPIDLVQIGIPVLVEAVVAVLAIAAAMAWVIIMATEVPQ